MSVSICDVITSKPFQRLKGKTQLYSPFSNDHYRNRLTHSLEVFSIANQIADNFKGVDIDHELLGVIALCHDIGHTPYGHEGERTLNEILSGKDNLGGLLPDILKKNNLAQGFKHNIYSSKLFLRTFPYDPNNGKDYKIVDGIMKHTKPFYKDKAGNVIKLDYGIKNIVYVFPELNNISNYEACLSPISIEGKIVNIADEIAQRCSDFTDSMISKLLLFNDFKEHISDYIDSNDEAFSYKNAEKYIREKLINGVIFSADNILFDEYTKGLNDRIEQIITDKIQSSYLIRSDDSKNCYMIRQVFKAYYQKPSQLDDSTVANIYSDLIYQNVRQVKKFVTGNRLDIIGICDFIKKACSNVRDNIASKYDVIVFKVAMLNIAYYIANMTDSFLQKKFMKLYNGGIE